jgi:hypothetical protein
MLPEELSVADGVCGVALVVVEPRWRSTLDQRTVLEEETEP